MKIAALLRSLNEARVRYVIVGGLAVQLHGFLRSTFDIDLTLAMDDTNLSAFIDVANEFQLRPVVPVAIDSLRDADQIDRWHRDKGMLAFALREADPGGFFVDVLGRSSRGSIPMSDHPFTSAALDEAGLLRRLEQFEQNRDFFIQAWLQNPALARQAGARVMAMLAPLPDSQPAGSVASRDPAP